MYIAQGVSEFRDFFSLKFIGIYAGVLYSLAFGDTDSAVIMAIVLLITADFATGISAAHRMGKEISSRVAFRTPLKMFFYLLMVMCAHQVGVTITHLDGALVAAMSGFLAVNEFISIIENFGNMGYRTPKKLLNKLRHYAE